MVITRLEVIAKKLFTYKLLVYLRKLGLKKNIKYNKFFLACIQ